MANPKHVEIVKKGKEAVENYQSLEGLRCILDLSDADFSRIKLDGIDFGSANLKGINFTDALLINCRFNKIDFDSEIFKKAKLSNSEFTNGSFNECDYSNYDFRACQFIDFQFKNCKLQNTLFEAEKLRNIGFIGCNLEKTHFGGAALNGVQTFSSCDFTGSKLSNLNFSGVTFSQCKFINTDLSGANFSNVHLVLNDFTDSNLKDVNFSNAYLKESIFDNSNLSNADFYEANITLVNFKNARGLANAKNLDKSHVDKENVKYFDFCIREFYEKWCDWEKLRIFGKLPLFGASYAALIFIPLFFYFLAIYNDKVDIVEVWAKQSLTINHSDSLALLLIDRLHPLLVPNLSLVLLLSTLCLAIASSIYALVCPSRIKEFSKDQWTDQLGHSLVHYWALSWKYRKTRLTCLFFYIFGGIGVLWVIGNKVFNAAVFIFNNSRMTF